MAQAVCYSQMPLLRPSTIAHLSVQVEAGTGLTTDLSQSRPADILVQDWDAASEAAELKKHTANDTKCTELGWVSVPLVVVSYGARGKEAQQ